MSSVQNKFPSIDRDQWRAIVTATMKDKNSKSLDRVDEDGLKIKALYEIQGHETAAAGKNTVTACAISRLPVNPEAHLLTDGIFANRLARMDRLRRQIGSYLMN